MGGLPNTDAEPMSSGTVAPGVTPKAPAKSSPSAQIRS